MSVLTIVLIAVGVVILLVLIWLILRHSIISSSPHPKGKSYVPIGAIAHYNSTSLGAISAQRLCDANPERALLVDYLQRVYNGTPAAELWRLTESQLMTLFSSLDFLYIVPTEDLPPKLQDFLQLRRRYVASETKPRNAIIAANQRVSPPQAPIGTIVSNWSGENNQAYLFQTQMTKGRNPRWWGNLMFADPMRASLRRGMTNTPQNVAALFDARFGAGGIPSHVLAEIAILPVDSPFAPPGTIQTTARMPNVCNAATEKTCTLNTKSTRPSSIYSYYLPGTGVFVDSGNCAYMYNFIDGFLNIPPKCYTENINRVFAKGTPREITYPELLSPRLPSGLPDYVTGVSKIALYLYRAMINAPDTVQVQLPLKQDGTSVVPNGGKGTHGHNDPTETNGPPRAANGPRSFLAQIAALMGVYSKDTQAGNGLLTSDGHPRRAQCLFVDRRKFITGWVNGRWYGFPPQADYKHQAAYSDRRQNVCSVSASSIPASVSINGVSGQREIKMPDGKTNTEQWTNDGYFIPTADNPLRYYGLKDPKTGIAPVVYETWYEKPIQMEYETACILIGLFYSMGDTGWESSHVCWPFGSYFSYAEDLGVGKYLIGGNLGEQFGVDSLHYTMTSTSLSQAGLVSPAYDYEIVFTLDDAGIQSYPCFCSKYVKSANLLYDDGAYLETYVSPAKGVDGGWMPLEAARPYDGTKGLSNFTAVYSQAEYDKLSAEEKQSVVVSSASACSADPTQCFYVAFDPAKPNMITHLTNELHAQQC